jgi:hypothetical protein
MRRGTRSWLRHLRVPTVVALVAICTSSCNDREFPTSQASATVRPTSATTGPFYSDLGNGWATVLTLGGPTATVGAGSDINALRLSAAVGHTAAYEFGTIRSKFAKTCRGTLPDGRRVEAVLSSDDTAGLSGQSAMSRMSLSVNGVTRYTIEYSNRKEGGRWAVYAARYTLHDDSGRTVAHGLLRKSNGRLVSAAQRSTPTTVADATQIAPRFEVGVAPPRPSFDVTSDVQSIWCSSEFLASVSTAAIAAGAAASFATWSAACLFDVGSIIYAAMSRDWASLDPTMTPIDDCKHAITWFNTMTSTAAAASTAAGVLTACITAHTPVIVAIGTSIIPEDGGSGTCQEWEVGFYDDYGNWWTLDSFQTCNRAD